ncbi:FixH family protein [Pontibacillus sp. ALD_SL1]|uniref:FixH family protein n=1 Tax=Pontibacillus sp. ALD_SL1 TaxID=2777185 RepID=UPI001A97BF9D|nr:FixH family protein [Pontibacillus sp. ALD_SL1]QSS99644.1 FixH family protein [Pontibacillus sp. ALD_SL1]
MRRRQFGLIFFTFSLLLLAACGGQSNGDNDSQSSSDDEEVKMLNVDLTTDPTSENVEPGEPFTIQAAVTYGEEEVNDAEEVRFEFWKKGEEHEEVDAEFTENGNYVLEKTVEEPGVYYVISHVTARGMHNMPQKEIVVGDVNPDEIEENAEGEDSHSESEEGHDDHNSDESAGHDQHGHGTNVMAHIMLPQTVKAGKEVTLTGHLQQDEAPVKGAEVQFEIWKEDSEKHNYVDATEPKDGEYQAAYTFDEAATYHVKLHYKKDDMHDHKEKTINVQ